MNHEQLISLGIFLLETVNLEMHPIYESEAVLKRCMFWLDSNAPTLRVICQSRELHEPIYVLPSGQTRARVTVDDSQEN